MLRNYDIPPIFLLGDIGELLDIHQLYLALFLVLHLGMEWLKIPLSEHLSIECITGTPGPFGMMIGPCGTLNIILLEL